MTPLIPRERFEVFASGIDHPECCAFDREGYLWAGGEAGQVYRIAPSGRVETIANVGGFCSGLALSPDDHELFVCVAGRGIVRVSKNGDATLFASHAGDHGIVAANFLLFDRRGTMYATDCGNWMKQNGYLLQFETDGKGEIVVGPLGYANGLALSSDEQTLFMVESDSERVVKFKISTDGALGEHSVFAEGVERLPDGLALDEPGNLYVSCYASDSIWRISPQGEKSLVAHDRWGILLNRPTNLAFGGAGFDEIYVANLGRQTITRAKLGIRGQPLANMQ